MYILIHTHTDTLRRNRKCSVLNLMGGTKAWLVCALPEIFITVNRPDHIIRAVALRINYNEAKV